jgi:hypothetical protein
MTTIKLYKKVGPFAENKDLARDIRMKEIIPSLNKGNSVILDFANIDAATQSFVHALISDLIRNYGFEILDKISFKSCNLTVQRIITIVTEYMQESS